MFDDDTKIFREIRILGDASSLQIDLGRLKTWSQTSGLALNKAKYDRQGTLPEFSFRRGNIVYL